MTESAASKAHELRDRGREIRLHYKDINGRKGSNIYTRAPQLFDHFLSQTLDTELLALHETHTTTASTFALDATGIGGTATGNTDATAVAADAFTIASSLSFECDTTAVGKPMFFETRCKFTAVTGQEIFIGFADAKFNTNDITYAVTVTDSTVTTSASADAFGFLISGTATGGDFDSTAAVVLGGASSIGGTDTLFVPGVTTGYKSTAPVQGGSGGFTYPSSAVTVTQATYYTLRVELDANGNGTLYKDDAFFASFPAAITKSVPLGVHINVIARTTAQAGITLDYFGVGGSY